MEEENRKLSFLDPFVDCSSRNGTVHSYAPRRNRWTNNFGQQIKPYRTLFLRTVPPVHSRPGIALSYDRLQFRRDIDKGKVGLHTVNLPPVYILSTILHKCAPTHCRKARRERLTSGRGARNPVSFASPGFPMEPKTSRARSQNAHSVPYLSARRLLVSIP